MGYRAGWHPLDVATRALAAAAVGAQVQDSPVPHLHRDWARPAGEHLHRDWGSPLTMAPTPTCGARRSIVIARDLPAGHVISESDITYKRPGTGVSPMFWDEVIGKKTLRALAGDDVLQWSDLEG